jgi:hypothetical protein
MLKHISSAECSTKPQHKDTSSILCKCRHLQNFGISTAKPTLHAQEQIKLGKCLLPYCLKSYVLALGISKYTKQNTQNYIFFHVVLYGCKNLVSHITGRPLAKGIRE